VLFRSLQCLSGRGRWQGKQKYSEEICSSASLAGAGGRGSRSTRRKSAAVPLWQGQVAGEVEVLGGNLLQCLSGRGRWQGSRSTRRKSAPVPLWQGQVAEEAEVLGGNLLRCLSAHYRSHMISPVLEPGAPRWEASN
jgi:hypothetical protein